MNKENCALKLVDEIILYYDARSKKYQITFTDMLVTLQGETIPSATRLQAGWFKV